MMLRLCKRHWTTVDRVLPLVASQGLFQTIDTMSMGTMVSDDEKWFSIMMGHGGWRW
jgi:hypothetical protein